MANPGPDIVDILLTYDDSVVLLTSRGQSNVVGVVGAEHHLHCCGAKEVVGIGVPQSSQVADGDGLYTAKL